MADNTKFEKVYFNDTGNIPLLMVNCVFDKSTNTITSGTELPEPSSYEGNTSTLVDGGRNVKGVYIGTVVRNDVAKISCKWNYLTTSQWASILACFNTDNTFTTLIRFYDQTSGKYAIGRFYVSDRKAGMFKRNENGVIMGWTNCSISFIEV